MTDQPISREVARSAANWLSLLHSGEASRADQQACLAWRAGELLIRRISTLAHG